MAVREYYSHAIADRLKEKKRKEAAERTEKRAGRTDEQQLRKLADGGYVATKEKNRLQVRISK